MLGGDNGEKCGPLHCCFWDTETREWVEEGAAMEPCRRAWHTTTFVPQRKMCLVFGGERQGDGAEVSEILAALIGFDLEQKVYFDCVTGGTAPSARTGKHVQCPAFDAHWQLLAVGCCDLGS
jgi:hypothetical protein